MATKSKTTTKPRTAKKTVKGSSGLKQNKVNWKFIIVLLVLVTAVGGYFAYRSQVKAAGNAWVPKESPPFTTPGGGIPKVDGSGKWVAKTSGEKLLFIMYFNASNNNAPKTYCIRGELARQQTNILTQVTQKMSYDTNFLPTPPTSVTQTVNEEPNPSLLTAPFRFCYKVVNQPIPPAGKEAKLVIAISHGGGPGEVRVSSASRQ